MTTSPSLQLPSGMIPWFQGGHCDPWNHVESAMALDVVGRHDEAAWAYDWLAATQRPDGSWHNYYRSDGTVEERKLDTNVCAYIATGVWHHFRCTSDQNFLADLWPAVERALDWVLAHRRHDRTILWAVEPHERPWDYALLTGTCSIQHALRCGAAVGLAAGVERPDWVVAADELTAVIVDHPGAFEPKHRWAMDWYYPVLTGALDGEAAKARLTDGWETFAMEELGRPMRRGRAVGDGVGDGRVCDRLRRDRRHRDGNRPAAVDPRPSPRRSTCRTPGPTGPASCTRRATCSPAASTRRTPPPR